MFAFLEVFILIIMSGPMMQTVMETWGGGEQVFMLWTLMNLFLSFFVEPWAGDTSPEPMYNVEPERYTEPSSHTSIPEEPEPLLEPDPEPDRLELNAPEGRTRGEYTNIDPDIGDSDPRYSDNYQNRETDSIDELDRLEDIDLDDI